MLDDPSQTPRRPCPGGEGKKRRCWARDGSEWCRNHDPAEEERRRRAGGIRHPRFGRPRPIAQEVYEAPTRMSIGQVLDRVANVIDLVEDGQLEPKIGAVCIMGLRLMLAHLHKERDYEDRLKFAWEHQAEIAAARERARADAEGSENGTGHPSAPPVTPPGAPWMRLKEAPPNDTKQ